MERNPKIDAFIREKGAELEAAMREAGSPLPPGMTGPELVESGLVEGERRAKSPEGQALFKRMKKLVEQVAAELPGGLDDPQFLARLEARSHELFGDGGPAASA